MQEILGVDVGKVIIDRANDGTPTSMFSDGFLKATPVPGALSALKKLADEKFGKKIYIVSKCGIEMERKTLEWFLYNDFYEKTGISPDNVYFCRSYKGKNPICRDLGVTKFIDDRIRILKWLKTVPTRYLFQPEFEELKGYEKYLETVKIVNSWSEIIELELE